MPFRFEKMWLKVRFKNVVAGWLSSYEPRMCLLILLQRRHHFGGYKKDDWSLMKKKLGRQRLRVLKAGTVGGKVLGTKIFGPLAERRDINSRFFLGRSMLKGSSEGE